MRPFHRLEQTTFLNQIFFQGLMLRLRNWIIGGVTGRVWQYLILFFFHLPT